MKRGKCASKVSGTKMRAKGNGTSQLKTRTYSKESTEPDAKVKNPRVNLLQVHHPLEMSNTTSLIAAQGVHG